MKRSRKHKERRAAARAAEILRRMSEPRGVEVYVDASKGNDADIGTAFAPVKTLAEALGKVPASWTGACQIVIK